MLVDIDIVVEFGVVFIDFVLLVGWVLVCLVVVFEVVCVLVLKLC